MGKFNTDAVAAKAIEHLKLDAAEANVFARELLRVRSQVFEIKFPELKAMSLIPRNTEVNGTDEEYTYRVATEYGTTQLGSSYSGNAPRADVSMVEATPQRIRPVVNSYGYDIQEARIAARTGNGLPTRKANAARKAIMQELDRILALGDTTKYGATLNGLLTLTGGNAPLTQTPTTGSGSGDTEWEGKTPDEILADMFAASNKIVTNSSDVEHPTTMLLPLSSYTLISTKRLGDGSDVTILKHFLSVSPYIREVIPWHLLESNTAWTGKRAVVYDRSSEVLESLVPIEFEQFAPQMINMETITSCHARVGGVVVYRPKAICYMDEI